MNNEDFKRLVTAVKSNPALLHALAFEPKKAARETDFIAATDRTMLAGMQAENLLGHALGILQREGCEVTCQATCGAQTCTSTCGPTSNADIRTEEILTPAFSADASNNAAKASARFAVSFYNRAISGGMNVSCGPDYTCCCTSSTCSGVTCGGSTCDVTCSGDSCGNTCGDSCGYTTNITFDPLRRERELAQASNQTLLWK